jgi:outer membrane lipoprotein carrier protein
MMTGRAIVCALLLLAPAVPAAEPPPALDETVRGLQRWLDGTRTLESRFRQALVSGALGATTVETGRMYLERPGKLRWDYLEPERKIAILVGRRTELYLEEEGQLTRGELTEDQGIFPTLLAGGGRVGDLFATELAGTGHGGLRLKLTPKGGAAAVSEVVLTLRRGDYAIEAADVLDEMGNRTTYALYSVKRNGTLPAGIFAFEPPPGTQVVDER